MVGRSALGMALALIAAAATGGAAAHYLLNVDIGVNVSVPQPSAQLTLNVNSSKGSEEFVNVTNLELRQPTKVLIKVKQLEVKGDVNISLSGVAVMRSLNGAYNVPMPCMLNLGVTCFRAMYVIPGWDSPITLPPGKYAVSLKISWREASGKGTIKLRLTVIELGEAGKPSAEVIGPKPSSTDGWLPAYGSTRSYAALVSPPLISKDGCFFSVWIWFLNRGVRNVTLKVLYPSGESAGKWAINLTQGGMYSEAVVKIAEPALTNYTVIIGEGPSAMSKVVNCSPP